jgi:hypothetical protein
MRVQQVLAASSEHDDGNRLAIHLHGAQLDKSLFG